MFKKICLRWNLHYKQLLYTSIIIGCGHLFLWGNLGGTETFTIGQTVLAAEEEITWEKTVEKITEQARVVSHVTYLLIRPLLVIAGFAMDNSMVYGKVFGLDVALWHLRTITRNLANFALGFAFLWGIFQFFIGQKKNAKDMVDLVKKTLIAGIIIQSSRFLMAAAVDVSTVATYSVGGLPISVMGDIQNTGWNVPILREEISSEPNGEIIRIKSTEDSRKISPCYTFNFLGEGENKDKSETLILARKYIYYQNGQGVWTGTKEKICHYHEDIYRFYSEDNSLLPTNATTEEDKQKGYNNNLLTLTSINITEAKDKITKGIFLQLRNDPFSQLFESDGTGKRVFLENGNLIPTPGEQVGLDKDKAWLGSGAKLFNLSEILNKSKSYVGVFGLMYTSLLSNVSDNVKNNTNNESFLNVVVKMLYEIALILPLAALVIVLVARIGILWVIIAIAPLMMLLRVFDSKKTIIDKDSIFSLENIAKLLIAPVLVSFAVSFSTMLIQIIQTLNELTIASEPTNFYNLFELNIKGAGFKFGKVVVSMFSVGIVWFLLFRAIKMNQIGKKIGGTLQKTAQDLIGNIPLIPLPGGGFTGFEQIKDPAANIINRWTDTKVNELRKDRQEALEKAFGLRPDTESTTVNTQEVISNMSAPNIDNFKKQIASDGRDLNKEYEVEYTTQDGKTQKAQISGNDYYIDTKKIEDLIKDFDASKQSLPDDATKQSANKSFSAQILTILQNTNKITKKADLERLFNVLTDEHKNNLKESNTQRTLTDNNPKPIAFIKDDFTLDYKERDTETPA